ncbi:MAG: acyl-CoA thioesterase [Acidobacteriota bacterium]|nr:acyl-CoA thioesterase [Acidobacteriota bacterium]
MVLPAVEWDLPDPFVIEVEVVADHIDEYDHTNNSVYLRWLDEIAWAHAGAVGAGRDIHQRERRGMANHRTELQFSAPAVLGDRLLVGDWIVHNDGRVRAWRRFQIVRPADGATVLRAVTQYVCIDIDSGRPKRFPQLYRAAYVVEPAVAAALESERWPFALKPG